MSGPKGRYFILYSNIDPKWHCADFRKCIVNVILATDMGLHNDYVAKFRDQANRLKQNGPIDISDEKTCDQERMLLFSAIIKCADIGNVVSKMGNKMGICVIPVLLIHLYLLCSSHDPSSMDCVGLKYWWTNSLARAISNENWAYRSCLSMTVVNYHKKTFKSALSNTSHCHYSKWWIALSQVFSSFYFFRM